MLEELSATMRISRGGQNADRTPETTTDTHEETTPAADEDDLWECLDKKVAEVTKSQTPTSSALMAINQYLEMSYLERRKETRDARTGSNGKQISLHSSHLSAV